MSPTHIFSLRIIPPKIKVCYPTCHATRLCLAGRRFDRSISWSVIAVCDGDAVILDASPEVLRRRGRRLGGRRSIAAAQSREEDERQHGRRHAWQDHMRTSACSRVRLGLAPIPRRRVGLDRRFGRFVVEDLGNELSRLRNEPGITSLISRWRRFSAGLKTPPWAGPQVSFRSWD